MGGLGAKQICWAIGWSSFFRPNTWSEAQVAWVEAPEIVPLAKAGSPGERKAKFGATNSWGKRRLFFKKTGQGWLKYNFFEIQKMLDHDMLVQKNG